MVNEVESILHEIRERVRAEEGQQRAPVAVRLTRQDDAEDRVISQEEKANFEESAALARLSPDRYRVLKKPAEGPADFAPTGLQKSPK